MVICDKCKTDKNVKRDFLIVWNGNHVDLCNDCSRSFGSAIEAIPFWLDNTR